MKRATRVQTQLKTWIQRLLRGTLPAQPVTRPRPTAAKTAHRRAEVLWEHGREPTILRPDLD